ncbi:MAG: hypothetical protein P1V13_22130 [Rhizobiaceae bacterium]|nr:hypothetical protein [Rhizobiaceae bacterium]
MSVYIEFPVLALPPANVSLALSYNTRPGQEATNGMRRAVGFSGAQWKMRFDVEVVDEEDMRAMRGFLFNLEGDSALVRIRMVDLYGIDGPFTPLGTANRMLYPDGISFATDALYATGTGHAVPTLEGTFAVAAALNDREIYATVDSELPGGCAISIDGFCYGIAGSWTEADGSNRLRLSPPLRKTAIVGDAISLAPVFIGSCVTQTPGYEALNKGIHGVHTLEFVEDLTRLVEV